MKIKNLAIRSIRGIVDIELEFDGKNTVIYGTNGTGKSAVVDSIDFLLTGQISRLTGSGTSGITLGKHGKHVDATDLSACYVEGVIMIDGQTAPINIKRYLNDPNNLIADDKHRALIEPVLEVAKKHQFLLTRREILKFITADGGSRSIEIQKLLKLDEIGLTRRSLVQVVNKLNANKTNEERNLANLRTELHTILGMTPANSEEALVEINKYRAVLEVAPLTDLDPEKFLPNGQETSQKATPKMPTQGEILKIITGLQPQLSQANTDPYKDKSDKLIEAINDLKKLGKNISVINTVDLLNQGLRVIHSHIDQDDSQDQCPLCLTEIDPKDLETSITQRLDLAKDINEKYTNVKEYKRAISLFINQLAAAIGTLATSLQVSALKQQKENLDTLVTHLELLDQVLKKEVPYLLEESTLKSQLDAIFEPLLALDFTALTEQVKTHVQSGTTKEDAISILAKTQEKVREINRRKKAVKLAKANHQRAVDLLAQFEVAQNEVIDELYASIKDRFVELYRDLHTNDESLFEADLQQDGASVSLSVDFYGRGQHPPHALHSEGHQDSMGVCLFLALNEKVSEGKVQTIVLDDVVTSVDTEHRKELCRMLKSKFPQTQLIITTHDTTWAQQMKTHGVVDKKNLIKFYGWEVDSGPKHASPLDIWEEITNAVNEDDVHSASSKLRRFSEEFYLNMCVDLRANVPCKLDGGWTLGDLFPNAWKKYSDLLKEAQKAARTWGNEQLAQDIETKISQGNQIYTRAWQEAWGVNRTTHFTYWENMTKADFAPVVEAFKDFYDFFTCPTCKQTCYVTLNQAFELESLTCECGSLSYKLRKNTTGVAVQASSNPSQVTQV